MKTTKFADIRIPAHRPYRRVRLDWRSLAASPWSRSQRARNQAG